MTDFSVAKENGDTIVISNIYEIELQQNYIMYRWLDETRSKLIDRFFVITSALLIARFQFSDNLLERPWWLLLYHIMVVAITMSFAYSIVRYRRQQRGHSKYIKTFRYLLKIDNNDFKEYKKYITGKKIYLTFGIEALIVIIATSSPMFLLIDIDYFEKIVSHSAIYYYVVPIVQFFLAMVSVFLVVIPFYRYNFKNKINWYND